MHHVTKPRKLGSSVCRAAAEQEEGILKPWFLVPATVMAMASSARDNCCEPRIPLTGFPGVWRTGTQLAALVDG